jgi:hypothetical protein
MTITLELDVDDALGREYERFSPENRSLFKHAVYQMLQKTMANLRSKKLKGLIDDIRSESGCCDLDPEIIYAIVRMEEY